MIERLYEERHHRCRVREYGWRGHRLIVLENEVLRVGVLATKGADVVELRHKPTDLDFLWHSPHPLLPPAECVATTPTPSGTFFDQYHGGWQESLPAGNGAPAYGRTRLGLHGEVSSLPWDVMLVDDRPERVAVEFSVRARRTPFWLRRTMIVAAASPFVDLHETLTNEGEEPAEYMWGHHAAFGGPLLQSGSLLDIPEAATTVPSGMPHSRIEPGEYAAWPHLRGRDGQEINAAILPGKEARSSDTLWLDLSGLKNVQVAIRNPRLGAGVGLEWEASDFPYLWSWQVFGGAWGYPFYGRAYLIALEPFTAPIGSLEDALHTGTARQLDPGASAKAWLRAGGIPGDRPFKGFGC